MTSSDPITLLRSPIVSEQSSGARALADTGTLDDVATLCEVAISAKSYGVRLASATAASEILYREKIDGSLPTEQVEAVLALIRFVDPEKSPALLLVLGAIGGEREVAWLSRLLRDPRTTVRVAALSAMRRMVLSHNTWEEAGHRERILAWLQDDRYPMDVRADLLLLCTEIGWTAPGEARLALPADAQTRQRKRLKRTSWTGLWLSDGNDTWAPATEAPHWLAIGGGWIASTGNQPSAFFLSGSDGVSTQCSGTLRMVWAPKLGKQGRTQAIQGPGKTWYKPNGKQITAWLKAASSTMTPDWQPILQDWLDVYVLEGETAPAWLDQCRKTLMKW